MKTKEQEPALFAEQEVVPPPTIKTTKPAKGKAVAKIEEAAPPMNVLDALASALKNPDIDPLNVRDVPKH